MTDWDTEIIKAQAKTAYSIGGREYERIKFGYEAEDYGADDGSCLGCLAAKGQYHVPFDCDIERCPACGHQRASCGCDYDEHGEE